MTEVAKQTNEVLGYQRRWEWKKEQRFIYDDEEDIFGGIHEKFLYQFYGYNYIERFTTQFGTGEEGCNNFKADEDNEFCYNDWLDGEGLIADEKEYYKAETIDAPTELLLKEDIDEQNVVEEFDVLCGDV